MTDVRFITAITVAALWASSAPAELRDLIAEDELKELAGEISGEAAKRNLDAVTLYHRTRASSQFRAAAGHVHDRLREYGLSDTTILEFPADGTTMFGTQKSRPAWDVSFAELWELAPGGESGWTRARKLGDWAAAPLTLAQDSLSGEATAGLVDVGAGTSLADYEGKNVRGLLILTSSQPEAVVALGVARFGAAGIVSYAPNQRSAWWKEDERLVRWGHLSSFPETRTYSFMISLGEARKLQQRLAAGEDLRFHAKVDAHHDKKGKYALVTATIPGSDRQLRDEEILFTCHLDHPRPGANDNASGCVAILEAARALSKLIDEGRIDRPKRTIRFLWPPEIEGSLIYLNGRPDLARRVKANIHLDMVGGRPHETKAVFRVSGGPESLPHFISDVAFEATVFVNTHSDIHAAGGMTAFPLTALEGGRESFLALTEGIDLGSDHQVFNEGSWRIPGVYLHDWPDRYIHTNHDLAANIDPTKLKRATFIALVTALHVADMGAEDAPAVLALLRRNALARAGALEARRARQTAADANAATWVHWRREHAKIDSVTDFAPLDEDAREAAHAFVDALADVVGGVGEAPAPAAPVYTRNAEVKGPMSAFGYSYLSDKLGAREDELALPRHTGHGPDGREFDGGIYTFEALNLVDGTRSVGEICAYLTGAIAPVPCTVVAEYLAALEEIGVLRRAK